jgi:hypothetical protein
MYLVEICLGGIASTKNIKAVEMNKWECKGRNFLPDCGILKTISEKTLILTWSSAKVFTTAQIAKYEKILNSLVGRSQAYYSWHYVCRNWWRIYLSGSNLLTRSIQLMRQHDSKKVLGIFHYSMFPLRVWWTRKPLWEGTLKWVSVGGGWVGRERWVQKIR